MRCFIGAFLADESVALARALTPRVPGFKPVAAENLHVTLRFLGEQPEAEARDIAGWVAALAPGELVCKPFAVTGLPSPGRARVLAMELQPTADLDALQYELSQRLGPPDRPFRPHVTLARRRRPGLVTPARLPPGLSLRLRAPRLYRSETLPAGARYTPVGLSADD